MISLSNVTKQYQAASKAVTAVHQVSLNIQNGRFVAITGKSGSGKTTLLNLISGLDRPTSGQIEINGVTLNELNEDDLATWRAQNVGIVFQSFQLLPSLTALENVMLPMELGEKLPWQQRRQKGLALLTAVSLQDRANHFPAELSGGEQQRVAIARALANDPQLILADEPTGNLDTETAETVFSLLENLTENNQTILLITHDPEFAKKAETQIQLVDGKVPA
ncbi:MAG: ABC transporter ATP-binding protein [Chloroflexota bacterium]